MASQSDRQSFVGGRELRKGDRQSLIQKIRLTVGDLIEQAAPGWLQVPPLVVDFTQESKALDELVKNKFTKASEWKNAQAYVCEFIESLSSGHELGLPVPTAPIRKMAKILLRSERWSKQRRRMNEAHEKWRSNLGRELLFELNDQESLGAILYLAATYGGLCEPRAICALALQIQEECPLFFSEEADIFWFELLHDPRRLANTRVDGKSMCLRRWFVPPVCRLSVLRYLRVPRAAQEASEENCLALIGAYYRAITDQSFPFQKLGDFSKVSFCVAERQAEVRYSQLLSEYSIGRQESVSATFGSFVSVVESYSER